MSGEVIVLAFKVASGAFAAYNVVKGLKEGNLVQAVLGGVSAYFAFSSLGSSTATQAATKAGATGVSNQAGALTNTLDQGALSISNTAGGAGTGVMDAMSKGLTTYGSAPVDLMTEGAVTSPLVNFGTDAASSALDVGQAGGWLSGTTDAASQALRWGDTASWLDPSTLGSTGVIPTDGGGGEGILSRIGGWAKDNQELASTGLKMGGEMLTGYAQGKAQEELLERRLREEAAARDRRGAVGGSGALGIPSKSITRI
jgi:hypothetical protein